MSERPWTDKTKTTRAYEQLKQLLLFQKIPPQTKLDIGLIASRLNVSKTPVREALIMLAGDKIIQLFPGSGYFSKSLNAADLIHDHEAAFAILKHMIEDYIERFPRDGHVLPPMERSGVGERLADFLEALVQDIVALSGNPIAIELIQAFTTRTTTHWRH